MATSNARPWQRIVEDKRKLREAAIQSFEETHKDPPEVLYSLVTTHVMRRPTT
jgi:hypothetical protein